MTLEKQVWQFNDNIYEKNFNPNFLCDLGVQKIYSGVKKEVVQSTLEKELENLTKKKQAWQGDDIKKILSDVKNELEELTFEKPSWQYDDIQEILSGVEKELEKLVLEKQDRQNGDIQKILSDVKKGVRRELFSFGGQKNNDVSVFKQTRFFEQMNYSLQKTILKEQIEFTKIDETLLKPLVFIVKTKTQTIRDRREYEDTIGRATVLSQSEMASIKKCFSDMTDILLKAEILCPYKETSYLEKRTSDKISFIETYIDKPIIKDNIDAKKLAKIMKLIEKYSQGVRMTFSNDINKEIKHASEKSIDEYIDNLHFQKLQKIFNIAFLFDTQFYEVLENTLRRFIAYYKNDSEDDFDIFFDKLDRSHSWEKPFAIYKDSEGVYTFMDNEDKIQDKKFFQELMYQAFYSFTKKETKTKKGIDFTKKYKSKSDASEWLSHSPESIKTITDKLFEQFNTNSDVPYCTCVCNEMNMYSNILEKVEQEKEKSKDIKTDFINIFKIQMQNIGWKIYSEEMKFDEKLMEAEKIDDDCFDKEKSRQDKIKRLFETKVRIMCGDTGNTENGENE